MGDAPFVPPDVARDAAGTVRFGHLRREEDGTDDSARSDKVTEMAEIAQTATYIACELNRAAARIARSLPDTFSPADTERALEPLTTVRQQALNLCSLALTRVAASLEAPTETR